MRDLQAILTALAFLLLLFMVYKGAVYFSARKLHRAARAAQQYFLFSVFPIKELAPHLQEGSCMGAPVSLDDGAFPTEWRQADEAELNSAYYLRTCRRVSAAGREKPSGGWYGLPAWIQDLVAAKGDPRQLYAPPPQKETRK